ncbi:MAG: DUF4097 family beta strand repeat protein [Thermoclostridium sp.]|nr:DUF4097 family beta strand repeat protein [Thermoclostridium sp.]
MNEKGRNILPMIGFILIVAVLMGGLAAAKGFGKNQLFDSNKKDNKSKTQTISFSGYSIDENGQVSTKGMDKISISAVNSEVKIETHHSDEVEAHFYGEVSTINKDALPYLEVVKEGKTAVVRIVHPNIVNISITGKTWLDVKVPESWGDDLEVTSVSGSINAPVLDGDRIQVSSVSGSINVESINGENVYLNTTSGSLQIGTLVAAEMFEKSTVSGSFEVDVLEAGEVKLGSTSGSTTVRGGTTEKVTSTSISGSVNMNLQEGSTELSTTSGGISVSFDKGFEDFKANSVSGSVTLQIPEDCEFKVNVNTISGDINCDDFSMKTLSSEKNHLEAEVGDGESNIEVHTTSGSVNIHKR